MDRKRPAAACRRLTGSLPMEQAPITAAPVVNGLSVDVEDWFQVGAFERVIERETSNRSRSGSRTMSCAFSTSLPRPKSRRPFSRSAGSPSATGRSCAGLSLRVTNSPATGSIMRGYSPSLRHSSRLTSSGLARRSRMHRARASPVTARRASRSTSAPRGPIGCWRSRATPIHRVSPRLRTITTAGAKRRDLRSSRCPGRSWSRSR